MPATRTISLVQQTRVAKPCLLADRPWGSQERSWHCGLCDKNVHNLSAMTETEGNTILAAGGHLCVRFVADEHGAPITGDRRWKLRWAMLRRTAGRLAAALGLATLLGSRLAGCSTGDVAYAGMYQSAPVDPKAKNPDMPESAPATAPASPR